MRITDRRKPPTVPAATIERLPRGALRVVMLLFVLGAGLLGALNGLGAADRLLTDFFASSLERVASKDVVIIAIDDKSLAQIGAWPWPRELHAALIERLSEERPRAIGFDVIFSDASEGTADEVLAASLARNGRVVLPVVIGPGADGADAAHLPTPVLTAASRGLGTVNLMVDPDGIVRSMRPHMGMDNQRWSNMVQAMLALDAPATQAPSAEAFDNAETLGVRIPYTGPSGSFLSLSYVDVLKGKLTPGTLQGKWLLVGATVQGMGDAHLTPVAGGAVMMPGVEILANWLDASLTAVRLRPLAPTLNALANMLIVVVSVLLMAWAGEAFALWLLLLNLLLVCALGYLLSFFSGLELAPAAGMLASMFAYLVWSWERMRSMVSYLLEQSQCINRVPQHALHLTPETGLQWLAGERADTAVRSLGLAVDQLRDLYQFVEDALASLPDATLVTDAQAVVQVVNVAARTRFEADWPILKGASLASVMARIRPLEGERVHLDAATLASGTVTRWEAGDEFDARLLVKVTPFKSAGGPNNGWIVSISDVTDLREAERNREEIMQFISHDMRSPQSSIMTMIDLHRLEGGGPLPEEKLNQIEQHVQRSLDMSTAYVQLAQAREADYELSDDVDLCELVAMCVEEMQTPAHAAGVTLQALWPHEPQALVEGDSLLLGRALVNLLGNAIKYSPRAGVVRARLIALPGAWRIEVQDQGPGIAADLQGQLFQRFHTLRQVENARHGAIGLGLQLVKVVVERHRGRVGVSSASGQGACFFVVLPASGARTAPPPDSVSHPVAVGAVRDR